MSLHASSVESSRKSARWVGHWRRDVLLNRRKAGSIRRRVQARADSGYLGGVEHRRRSPSLVLLGGCVAHQGAYEREQLLAVTFAVDDLRWHVGWARASKKIVMPPPLLPVNFVMHVEPVFDPGTLGVPHVALGLTIIVADPRRGWA